MPSRSFFSVVSEDLPATRRWFVDLLDYTVEFDSDWFVHLQDAVKPDLEVGVLARDHEIVPEQLRAAPRGGLLTVVVDDVDAVHERAIALGVEVLEPPRDLFYGQRRMLVVDPNGLVVDVSSECEPDPEWLASMG